MGSDERGKTIHGYLLNDDYGLLREAVEAYTTTINRFVSMATREALVNKDVRERVGQNAHLTFERRMNGVEMRQALVQLKAENEELKAQLANLNRTFKYR